MHGSELKDGLHSNPEEDPRPKLWPKVLGSVAIVGVMVGLMIGRLTAPDPLELQLIEPVEDGLVLWFNDEPKVRGEQVSGSLAMLFNTQGKAQRGEFKLKGKDVRWRVQRADGGLLLNLLAARPLHGDWHGTKVDGRWRLEVSLREE
ncbi:MULTISPECIES: hypothetical protein [unclassified Pseudomonas]|uniref:hypothetical protein n=1 Tax=unclassified Pseudomonas TaxID=196821 RepID=UPI002AC8D7A0|nr:MULTISPECIES: hypothetical protein [unclassified Pseudomonas]MEB0043531.1 hypothetical protein [Pseudomonas sp. MH10]MEB0076861.1 hypothetical protein [Pseudomonas sp. MH10out]MEB0091823.1 hypothetical protein [Pseudomonas sp. CCI4.2]MEB0103276.1 hypothetical protein [Pseudomonas sp. CCI3.2]MEB0119240.1 hypothetical protein [Pseudomonas sp. CCI1.2]